MKQLLKITFLLLPFITRAQTVEVYVNDTTFIKEPITLTGTDSTNGVIKASYTNHGNAPAYEVNYYYGHRSGLVKVYYPSGKLMRTMVYARGLLHGEDTWYSDAGKVTIKGAWVKGIKHGYWAYKSYGFMGKYNKGLKDGNWKYLLPDGTKGKLKFNKGRLVHAKNAKPFLPPNVPKAVLMEGVSEL